MNIQQLSDTEIKEAVRNGTERQDIRIRLGRIYRKENRPEDAIRQFQIVAQTGRAKDELWFKNWMLNEIEICQKKHILESKPRALVASLTNRCNIRCIMCEICDDPWDMSEKTVTDIKNLMPYLQYVTWSGGEPFLSDYFYELFNMALEQKELGQTVVTNGLLIDEQWAQILNSSKVTILMSIDGVSKTIYEQIRKGGKFEKLLKSIELLNKYKKAGRQSDLTMQMVVMKENFKELGNVMDFAQKHNFSRVSLIPLNDSVNDKNSFYHTPEFNDYITHAMTDITQQAGEYNIKIINGLPLHSPCTTSERIISDTASCSDAPPGDTLPPCLWPWQHICICSQDTIFIHCFCVHMPIGTLDEKSLLDIWNNDKIQEIR
ncbi:radical SAM/SPASM domain-containing protein, partial [Elusimicrobiota bacterium]